MLLVWWRSSVKTPFSSVKTPFSTVWCIQNIFCVLRGFRFFITFCWELSFFEFSTALTNLSEANWRVQSRSNTANFNGWIFAFSFHFLSVNRADWRNDAHAKTYAKVRVGVSLSLVLLWKVEQRWNAEVENPTFKTKLLEWKSCRSHSCKCKSFVSNMYWLLMSTVHF